MKTDHERANGDGLAQQLRAGVGLMGSELSQVDRAVRALVNERPVAALIVAVGLGYVTARVLARL